MLLAFAVVNHVRICLHVWMLCIAVSYLAWRQWYHHETFQMLLVQIVQDAMFIVVVTL
jgi:hypothetical protein